MYKGAHMKKIFVAACLLFTVITLSSCKYGVSNPFYDGNDVNTRTIELAKIEEKSERIADGKYSVLIFTDRHQGGKNLDFDSADAKLFAWLDEQENLPAFALCLGDSTDGGKTEQFQDYNQFTKKLQDNYGITTYTTCGNHDIYQYHWEDWKQMVYPNTSFYRIQTPSVSYYSLDTATGILGVTQMDLLKKAFESDTNEKIIFTHYPLYTKTPLFAMEDTVERNELLELFEKNNVKQFFAGHLHINETVDFNSFIAYTLPGFSASKTWGVLSVDEENKSYFFEIICKE